MLLIGRMVMCGALSVKPLSPLQLGGLKMLLFFTSLLGEEMILLKAHRRVVNRALSGREIIVWCLCGAWRRLFTQLIGADTVLLLGGHHYCCLAIELVLELEGFNESLALELD